MRSRVLFVVWVGIFAAVLAVWRAPTADAQSPDALKKAQASFDQAQIDYLQGKYDDAARGFQEAYAARDFPQFLYNTGAAFHMKGKKASDPVSYQSAVDFYKQYLTKDPQASDKAKVEKAIGVLEGEIKRLKANPASVGSNAGSAAAPSSEVTQLGDVKVRGLVVIESDPSNASIYLDSKAKGEFGKTPWSGTLEGEHKVIVEKRGYKVIEKTFSADPSKLFVFSAAMAQEDYLGWVEISSNVPGADIYIDDKSIGAVGKTPLSQNIKPGKHTFWISAEGYDEYKEEVEVIAGETHTIKAPLKGAPVGRLNISGPGIEDAAIYLDGAILCERGMCVKNVPQGDHTLTVVREGYKPYVRKITIQPKTEMKVKVVLSRKPGRSDAIVAYVLAAGFTGGGIFLGLQANKYRDELRTAIESGDPPPDPEDPRFTRGKIFAIAADATFVIAGITALTAVYYTFRDKGAPSTALIEVNSIALQPHIGLDYAGIGMEVHW
jgi:tetratricopeptide (TPR) repeat protein